MAVGRHVGYLRKLNFEVISVSRTSVLVSEPNFVRICAIATELWPFKWIFKMAAAAILDFMEVKFDVTGSRWRPVSTSRPNLVKITQRAAELWRFMCFQNGRRPPSWIFAEVKFGGISVSGTSVLVFGPNFVRICAIATEIWPFKWIFKMAAAAILNCSEMKLDVTWSHGRPVSTATPNLAAELWRFMCFKNGGRPPSWIFAEVKFWGISVSGTSVLVSEPHFVRICSVATELWTFKWIFKMAAAAVLDFLEVKSDVTGSRGQPVCCYLLWVIWFLENSSKLLPPEVIF